MEGHGHHVLYGLHEELLPLAKAGKIITQQVAKMVELPEQYVSAIMDDGWKELRESTLVG